MNNKNNNKSSLLKLVTPLFISFIFINCFFLAFQERLMSYNINSKVVVGANCILFFISTLSIAFHFNAIKTNNPKALVRSVMLSTTLKFLLVATAILIYVKVSATVNKPAIYCAMFLYIIYTIIEASIALKLNKYNGNN